MNKIYRLPVAALILVAMVLFSSCQTKNLTSAKIYIQQDNWTNALKQLELAVEATPENAEVAVLPRLCLREVRGIRTHERRV